MDAQGKHGGITSLVKPWTSPPNCMMSVAFKFITSVLRRPGRTRVKMIALSRSPAGLSGITASRRTISSVLSPLGVDGVARGRSS
jgi:hypothetical protein